MRIGEIVSRSEPSQIRNTEETKMKSLGFSTQKNRLQVAASVLLVVALVIPLLAWADPASDQPYGQFDDPSSISPSEAYAALVEKYRAGELVFHAPGRQDDRSFSASATADLADAAFLAANSELMAYRRYVASRRDAVATASSARWAALGEYYTAIDAGFVAVNPEIMAYRRYDRDGCSALGQVC
jgi:hypothetical protein